MADYFKYRQKLNIEHTIGKEDAHVHTLEIIIYLLGSSSFTVYDKLDKILEDFFAEYEGKKLNDMAAFLNVVPTIENIGAVFYGELKPFLKNSGYEITRLEIGENPSRLYAVTDFLISGKLSESSMEEEKRIAAYIEKNYAEFTREYEKKKTESIAQQEAALAWEEDSRWKGENDGTEEGTDVQTQAVNEAKGDITAYDKSSVTNKQKGAIDATAKIETPRTRKLSFYFTVAAVIFSCIWYFAAQQMELLTCAGDVYLHLGKSEYLLSQLAEGRLSPIYMENWYNGYLMFMHCEPLAYYLLAFFGNLVGDIEKGYLVFTAFTMLVGVLGFIRLGKVYERPVTGFFAGVLWFFIPEMTRGWFITGDVKLMLAVSFIPLLISFVFSYYNAGAVSQKKHTKRYITGIAVIMCLIVLSDLAMAVITAVSILMFMAYRAVKARNGGKYAILAFTLFIGFGLSAVWIYSAYANNSIPDFTINREGFTGVLVVMLLHAVSMVFGNGRARSVNLVGIFAGIMAVYFVPQMAFISYCTLFIVLVEWENGKKVFVSGILLAIFISNMYYFDININYNNTVQNENSQKMLKAINDGVVKAQQVTDDKLLYLEVSKKSTFPAYYMTLHDKKIVFANRSSTKYNMLADNIRLLEYALYSKKYDFVFDRSIELGCDTILICKNELAMSDNDAKACTAAGVNYEYRCVEDNKDYIIYHRDLPESSGVATKYEGIAIGDGADAISILYPYFRSSDRTVIDDYTFEELSQYRKVYLSGFTYRNLDYAQDLVVKLANNGTHVYIDMDTIQANPMTNRQVFLDVTAQNIVFKTSFPILKFSNKNISAKQFYKEYSEWNTVYLENLDNVIGSTTLVEKTLPFYGTKYNGMVHFIGFNLVYHVIEANDLNVEKIVDDIFDMDCGTSPQRTFVELTAEYDGRSIKIYSSGDAIAGIAMQNNFRHDDVLEAVNNLVTVSEGYTQLDFNYSGMYIGAGITAAVLLMALVAYLYCRKGRR